MFQPKKYIPAPITVSTLSAVSLQDAGSPTFTRHPAKFLTLCSGTTPTPKQPSILLPDDNVSVENESSPNTASTKNSRGEISSDENRQCSSDFIFSDSIYQLPSQKITPIHSISEIEDDSDNEEDIRREICNSLKAVRRNEAFSPLPMTNNNIKAVPVGNAPSGAFRRHLTVKSPTNNARPITGAHSGNSQYKRPIAVVKPTLEFDCLYKKSNVTLRSKQNDTSEFYLHEGSGPVSVRGTNEWWKDNSGVHNKGLESSPSKSEAKNMSVAGMKAKLQECLIADVQHNSGNGFAQQTPKATHAWTIKCQTTVLSMNSPVKSSSKIKVNTLRILTGEKSYCRTPQMV